MTPTEPLQLSVLETKQLWWFLDGAIMSHATRARLAAAWGFCPRHTWCYVTSEVELRLTPRGTLVLYEDLLTRAGTALESGRRWANKLRVDGTCITCDYVGPANPLRLEGGWDEDQAQINARTRMTALLVGSRATWEPRTCPECLGGSGPLCRMHLLAAGKSVDEATRTRTRETLERIRAEVEELGKAISWPRRDVAPEEWAALVEALGWFAGWAGVSAVLSPEPS